MWITVPNVSIECVGNLKIEKRKGYYGERKAKLGTPLKAALEDLLRARRLLESAPPLRGEDRRALPLATGVTAIDSLLRGGFPKGTVSQITGAPGSGRTGLALALAARSTQHGALCAWLDPGDRLDPASAAAAGVVLERLLWLRGEPHNGLVSAVSAAGTLLGSGLFEAVILDLASQPAHEIQRLPGPTWLRLQRTIENAAVALVLVAEAHVVGPSGALLALTPHSPRWSGPPGPARLLRGLETQVQAGRYDPRCASVFLETSI
jgi:hypothetical protein